MRNSAKVLFKAGLPALAMMFVGSGSSARMVDHHSYRKHVLEPAYVAAPAIHAEGMRWSALSST